MKTLKVYLQYPWKFPDSPYYKYLIDNPPKNIQYLNVKNQKGVITNKRFFFFSNFLKKNIRKLVNFFNFTLINSHKSPKGDYDLIHCAHCLSKNNVPWVADIESWWSMSISNPNTKKSQKKIKKILLSKNCKKIIPWSKSTERDILEIFPEIENKMEVLYPAIPEIKMKTKKTKKNVQIIFVSRYFELKGGLIALEIMKRLKEKKNIEGIVISNVPKEIKNKFKEIRIYDLLPPKKVLDLMGDSDIFLYPGSVDTFGFSLLEAMSLGLPVVTINTESTKSRKEIVENKKTGLILDVGKNLSFKRIGEREKETINQLVKMCSRLIKNKSLRKKMSKNCLQIIKEGKFSIKERNKQLKRIYEEAVR